MSAAQNLPEYICATNAIDRLVAYCRQRSFDRFVLLADENTYPVIGERLEQTLTAAGAGVTRVILPGQPVVADQAAITRALLAHDGQPATFLAAGAGTITDVTRFVSHRAGCPFISVPSAPSVDGFASGQAALTIEGFKLTVPAQAPLAIIADLETLCKAPKAMIAAGYGDLVGKFTSLADWRLGALLWDEPYQEACAQRTRDALEAALEQTEAIAENRPEGIKALMDALVESGFSMLISGGSRPASGSEHHLAHFWEMRWLQAGKTSRLHGEKVGVASGLIARLYARVKALSAEQAGQRLASRVSMAPDARRAELREVYGPLAETALASQRDFLDLDRTAMDRKILQNWPKVLEICASVPAPEQICAWLGKVNAACQPADLGITQEEVSEALRFADALRSRFTVLKLAQMLGFDWRNDA